MADRYLIETSAVDGYQLEDGSGVWLLEPITDVFHVGLHPIEHGMVAFTASGMNGVMQG